MAKEAVVTIVEHGSKILVVKKVNDGKSLMSDLWHFPGETKHENEDDKQAVTRGIQEEAGITVEQINYLTSSETSKGTKLFWYTATATDDNVTAGDDAVEAKWVNKEDVATTCDKPAVDIWPIAIKQYFGLID